MTDPDPHPTTASPTATATAAGLTKAMPFTRLLGAVFTHVEPGEVRARLDWSPERCTAGGILHGGPTGTTTVESKTNFLKGVRQGFVEATSTPLHIGRTVIVVETDLRDEDQRLVAHVTQTQLVLI